MYKFVTIAVLLILMISIGGNAQYKQLSFQHGSDWIKSVNFIQNGNYVVSASFDGSVIMWEIKSGKRVWQFDLDEKRTNEKYTISHIQSMVAAPDGNSIAVSYDQDIIIGNTAQGNNTYRIALLDAKNGQLIKTLAGHTFLTRGLAFSPDSKQLLSVSGDKTARLWDVRTGQEAFQMKLKEKGGIPVFMPNGKQLIIVSGPNNDGTPPVHTIGLFEAETGTLLREFSQRGYGSATNMALSPDGKYLVIDEFVMPNVTTRVWDLGLSDTQTPRTILSDDKKLVRNYVFSADGKFLAYSAFRKGIPHVVVREFESDRVVTVFRTGNEVESIAFSPNGSQIAIGMRNGKVSLIPFSVK